MVEQNQREEILSIQKIHRCDLKNIQKIFSRKIHRAQIKKRIEKVQEMIENAGRKGDNETIKHKFQGLIDRRSTY